ncbi:MAG: universal stress protein, partial [Planctomycetes bacterium]|nr:universal stress protein [Planctomycetota bacterium]
MLPIRRILHPTDFSESCRPAFELACSLARDYSASLVLAHVVPPTHVFAPDGIAVPFPAEEPYEARARLARIHPTDRSVEVEHRLLEGDPAEMILRLARDASADIIVMGTHGSSGLTRLLVGSVAESVMRKAPCPVLTVRQPSRIAPAHAPEPAPKARPNRVAVA